VPCSELFFSVFVFKSQPSGLIRVGSCVASVMNLGVESRVQLRDCAKHRSAAAVYVV
jgi:hypothetical protein